MQVRDRLVCEVAKELGIPHNKTLEVVSSQTELVRKAMQNKEATSVYLRKVGTFISGPVRYNILKQKIENKNNKNGKK